MSETKPGVTDYRERLEQAARTAAPIFRLYGWTWGGIDKAVPSEEQILDGLEALLGDIIEYGSTEMSCGRFLIRRYDDGELNVCLQLA